MTDGTNPVGGGGALPVPNGHHDHIQLDQVEDDVEDDVEASGFAGSENVVAAAVEVIATEPTDDVCFRWKCNVRRGCDCVCCPSHEKPISGAAIR